MPSTVSTTSTATTGSCSSRCRGTRRQDRLAGQSRPVRLLSAGLRRRSLRANLDRNVLPRNTWSAEQLDRTFQEIRRIEAGGATVGRGDDETQWHRLKEGGDADE